MDWADSEELMEIYLHEVDQRSESLTEGATALANGTLDSARHEELVRDAHTLKGSSHMVGKPEVGEAAAVLERAWKHVRQASKTNLPVLGSAMLEATRAMHTAAREREPGPVLHDASRRLSKLLEDESSEPPQGPPVTSESDIPVNELVSTPVEHDSGANTLGGLLPSLEADLEGAVMRVDTGDLYTLINRIVEIGIEVQSLDDLALVSFGDEGGMLEGWQSQISRMVRELGDLQRTAVSLVNVPLAEAIETFPQFVRFLGRRLNKSVRLDISGADVHIDRQIVDLMREPLRHLIVNAVDHGLETEEERAAAGKPARGTVSLNARIEDDRLIVSVSDDGRGVDWEAVSNRARHEGLPTSVSELRSHLLRSGFTTEPVVSDFSGTGEGLALLADAVDKVSGSVMITSEEGRGTTVMVDLPVSLVLQRIVTVASGSQVLGLAEAAVIDTVPITEGSIAATSAGKELVFDDERIPYLSLAAAVGLGDDENDRDALILSTRSGLVATGVGEILGSRNVAVKGVGPILEDSDHIAGAAFLGGGQVLVIADHHHLGALARRGPLAPAARPVVLAVDDSAGVRQLIAATLRGNGFEVEVAGNGDEARTMLFAGHFDALVVDYSMPGSNGAELVASIRSAGATLPIVMVSGVAEPEDKAAAWQAGVDAYLNKYDLRRGALTESIRRLLAERSSPHV
ncbi:MAG: response regulator [Acidimicrobiia bacterium]|nr:response regulator [Acidimicrobiia bacterium]MDH4307079.1 response regulator [Acidimicrobiia bacterium]MDH5293067.1 response regulator [Acidimicrobiia bacterium]